MIVSVPAAFNVTSLPVAVGQADPAVGGVPPLVTPTVTPPAGSVGAWETVTLPTPVPTIASYSILAEVKVGESIPSLRLRADRVASLDRVLRSRYTTTVYVAVVVPSSAITVTVIVVSAPAAKAI